MTKDVNQTDCMPCRLISGFGVFGMGIYVHFQARYYKNVFSKRITQSLGIGVCGIGIARLLDLPPFRKERKS
ncbi:hypothetical protein LSTR_LSTR017438 [Laodelphax striatellus]|uniref:Distal membrane-arm assembly complex protein 1-like domain-containing protein n=1 Tax=Laodelphax striatellus TaxID=195883 RepID=A0A482WZ75_LAOST|nr:hypothetical protein LSTR_LSTR017438 [Laodelphax striatellus]